MPGSRPLKLAEYGCAAGGRGGLSTGQNEAQDGLWWSI